MTTESSLRKREVAAPSVTKLLRSHGWTVKTSGAVCGICGGFAVAGLGSLLTAIAWFTGAVWHGHLLQRDGTVLLFLTIPLLILGAHCLDLLDQDKKSSEIQDEE